ncbi:MAG TPA: condensation domain-containing protein [Ktedonosporobacter sp.]|jgi:acyl transferase domain-containing protein/alpha-ketoglutarate-dependent taurine dioxygenase|nr:condensation domain-containing protein [Ktedonosporobacter sp.]
MSSTHPLIPTVFDLLKKKQIDRDAARVLLEAVQTMPAPSSAEQTDRRIAIIGIAAELPGAKTFDDFWDVLLRCEDRVSELPPARRRLCEDFVQLRQEELGIDQEKPFWSAAWLEDIDKFDPAFFNITPAEARAMDPQQRRFLQTAYHCFEDAGYAGQCIRDSRTGVYASAAMVNYVDALAELTPQSVPGNVPSFVASRVSYTYNLRGPSYTCSSTCASSLLALHEACMGLAYGDCDMALVGGVNIFPFPINAQKLLMNAAGIMSDEQRCRPFDNQASGIGRGEGVIALLLKPLTKALKDRDHIHAVILSTAVNNDGASASITAPNPRAHTELLLEAWQRAGISPESLSYLEAHGTGTHLGDPIEVRGITDAVRKFTSKRQFLATGSVKGNIGHLLDGAAGLSGLLKIIHVLKRGIVPPTKHLQEPNRQIDLLNSPIFIPTFPWDVQAHKKASEPLRAAVSCFGFNGTNVHAVLEEVPEDRSQAQANAETTFVFPFSARSQASLMTIVAKYAALNEAACNLAPCDVAYTLWSGREHFELRLAILASNMEALVAICRRLIAIPFKLWHTVESVRVNNGSVCAPRDESAIETLACSYVNNGRFLWHTLFEGYKPFKVSLPAYAFDESSYWSFGQTPKTLHRPQQQADSPLEKVLSIARSVLEVHTLKAEDNFLACGGNSLSGLQFISRLRQELHSQISHEELLTLPDFSAIAAKMAPLATSVASSVPPAHQNRQYPVSFAQQRFWFLAQMEAGNAFYNIPLMARLKGSPDVQALEQSLTEIQRRHDILRSSYPLDEHGMPSMLIHKQKPCTLATHDLQAWPDAEREQLAFQIAQALIQQPFDLENGPVWRAGFIKIAAQDHLLVVVMHHIITDIWSFKIFEQELITLYNTYAKQQHSSLPELPMQYGDFAVWQRQHLSGEELEQLTHYWKQQLGSYHRPLELPADRPRGAVRTLRGKTLPVEISSEVIAAVKKLCPQEGVTSFMVMLAAFYALLFHYTGQEDIVIGTEVANRTRVEAEKLIGAFVNQLALRTRLTGNPTFRELLKRVRKTTLEAYAHQDLPFEKLVEILNPERKANVTPLFSVKLLFGTLSAEEAQFANLIVEPVSMPVDMSPFDLTLRLSEWSGGGQPARIDGSLTYNTDLFDEDRILRFLEHFSLVLDQVVAEPDLHLSQIELMSKKEKEQKMEALKQRDEFKQRSLKKFNRRSVRSSAENQIKTSFLKEGDRFPLVIEPALGDVDLADWIKNNHDFVETTLLQHGAILFHNFKVASIEQFQQISLAVHPQLVEYSEPSTPRSEYSDKIYVSSEYPNYYSIPLHGELSYTYKWPMKALFYCKKAATKGGETPIADAREVLRRIDPRVREKFVEKQIMYLRNYGDGLLVPWQKVFNTTSKAEVEEYCRQNPPMTCEWLGENRLRTRQVRPAVIKHPVTGDEVWFNQMHIFHIYSLGVDMQKKLLEQFGEENLPVHALYGDGTRIENWELDAIYKAYAECTYAFPWQEGDVLLADNVQISHGRNAFEGERETVVSFVEPCPQPNHASQL